LNKEIKKVACPYCGDVLDSADDLKSHIFQLHKGRSLPGPAGQIRLTVNKAEQVFQVEPNWTLYYLIHDKLGLTGAKQFCDRGACGSCTMIVDGKPVLSCMMLAIECDGKTVETVEGIATEGHPLIESYVKNHAMQCGYCTPGFVVTSKALLDHNPNPTEEEIVEALSGNLCRCSTYPQHPIAVRESAAKMQAAINKGGGER
jgi:aerobic-type carbon monoxide dehydrogenase small subunit (CoxS/CutS family)